ncbi:LOXL2-like protein [Mya arenaria]|uniref:LOXL2-like protein n=1 Tax=Mya arenaria TaxID=6604 RepID=A0ABY7FL21_MYAAR|nr:LOXL2-like protein [Mya arenaria]
MCTTGKAESEIRNAGVVYVEGGCYVRDEELVSIREEVKDLYLRVETMENATQASVQRTGILLADTYSNSLVTNKISEDIYKRVSEEILILRAIYSSQKEQFRELESSVKDMNARVNRQCINLTLATEGTSDKLRGVPTNVNGMEASCERSIRDMLDDVHRNVSNVVIHANPLNGSGIYNIPDIICKNNISDNTQTLNCSGTVRNLRNGYYFSPCHPNIRLAKASLYDSTGVQGRLEVFKTVWGTVCDDSFEINKQGVNKRTLTNNVNVVCRTFGFEHCKGLTDGEMAPGNGRILMDNVECSGGEKSFIDCSHPGWGVTNCVHGEDVGFQMWN